MANNIPSSDSFTGLSRIVIQYGEAFAQLVNQAKTGAISDTDWAGIEKLVDVEAYVRLGVFSTAQAEVLSWEDYKGYVSRYAADYSFEATLRHITEAQGRVILELEERNSRDGAGTTANTVTIYTFNDKEKILRLEVYVMQLA